MNSGSIQHSKEVSIPLFDNSYLHLSEDERNYLFEFLEQSHLPMGGHITKQLQIYPSTLHLLITKDFDISNVWKWVRYQKVIMETYSWSDNIHWQICNSLLSLFRWFYSYSQGQMHDIPLFIKTQMNHLYPLFIKNNHEYQIRNITNEDQSWFQQIFSSQVFPLTYSFSGKIPYPFQFVFSFDTTHEESQFFKIMKRIPTLDLIHPFYHFVFLKLNEHGLYFLTRLLKQKRISNVHIQTLSVCLDYSDGSFYVNRKQMEYQQLFPLIQTLHSLTNQKLKRIFIQIAKFNHRNLAPSMDFIPILNQLIQTSPSSEIGFEFGLSSVEYYYFATIGMFQKSIHWMYTHYPSILCFSDCFFTDALINTIKNMPKNQLFRIVNVDIIEFDLTKKQFLWDILQFPNLVSFEFEYLFQHWDEFQNQIEFKNRLNSKYFDEKYFFKVYQHLGTILPPHWQIYWKIKMDSQSTSTFILTRRS